MLSGCTHGPAPARTKTPGAEEFTAQLGEEVHATPTKGVIRGLVVDSAIRPVLGARVKVEHLGLETATNAAGAFAFRDLDVGSYLVSVTKNGYNATRATTTVEAGVDDPPLVRILLDANPQALAYYAEYKWSGFIQSIADGVILGADDPAFQREIQLDRVPTYMTSEVVWSSTQTVDRTLTQGIYWEGDNRTAVSGESPLFQGIDGAGLHPGRGDPNSITVRITGAYTTLNQAYDVYVHVFYGYKPPADWRFSSGDPVPQPP